MPRPQDDNLARGSEPEAQEHPAGRPGGSRMVLDRRTILLVGGFVLAVAATLAVFLTDNRQYLRIAVVAVAWAFVLAILAAGRRDADRATAAAREAQLRHAYELELEREVAARREYELDLEHDLRRESEDVLRDELDALRGEIASLGQLRDEVARVSELRHDLADLAALRDDLARVAALREDIAALGFLRSDLGQLADLRADLGRLRGELTEQLSSEMLVERIVMRTQGARLEPPARPIDVPARWGEEASPRELTGGWPAIRLDDRREAEHVERTRTDRATQGSAAPTAAMWSPTPPASALPAAAAPTPAAGPWTSAFDRPAPPPPGEASRRSWTDDAADRYPAARPAAPGEHEQASLEWLTARPLHDPDGPRQVTPPPVPPSHPPATEAHPAAYRPSPHPRPRPTPPPPSVRLQPDLAPRRRDGEAAPSTAERPMPAAGSSAAVGAGHLPDRDSSGEAGAAANGGRLAEILAENGVSPAAGGRRRRRYRDDDEPDDVLARVLGLR